MHRRTIVPSLSMLVAVVLLMAGAFAAGRMVPAPAAAQETIAVIEHASSDTVTDLGDEGDSMGDTLSFSNELYDSDDANVVGTINGSCVRTSPGKMWECSFTNVLEGGTISAQGPFMDTGEGTFAITGGTGEYSGASGELVIKARDGEDEKYDLTFTVN
jgi:allene oxide cyclase